MSEKKSWDIQPRSRVASTPQPVQSEPPRPVAQAPQRAREVPPVELRARKPLRRPKPQKVRREKPVRVVQGRDREPLRDQRRRARKRARRIFVVLIILAIAGLYGALWLPQLRITSVQASGPDADAITRIAQQALVGTSYYVIPRNSFFFVPEDDIRAQALRAFPEVAAVSFSHVPFSSLHITSTPREPAFIWCGAVYEAAQPAAAPASSVPSASKPANASSTLASTSTPATPVATTPTLTIPTCYQTDSQGFIFAPVTTSTQGALTIYAALTSSSTPIGNTVVDASAVPTALQFIKNIESLNVPITSLVLRAADNEADLYTPNYTRITYVLGHEHEALSLATAAFPTMKLTDGSLRYVDLRFAEKVYFAKKSDSVQQVTTSSSTPIAQ